VRLLGNDIHEGALSLCKKDAKTAGVLHLLDLSCEDCQDYQPPVVPSLVVTNPPWGERLTDSSRLADFITFITYLFGLHLPLFATRVGYNVWQDLLSSASGSFAFGKSLFPHSSDNIHCGCSKGRSHLAVKVIICDLSACRNEEKEWLYATWQGLGRFVKAQCSCADVYVLSGNAEVTRAMHMRADRKWPLTIGGQERKLLHYHVLPRKLS